MRTPSFIRAIAVGVDPVDRVGRLRQVDRDEVGARVELVGGLDPLHAEVAEPLRRDELVEARSPPCRRRGRAGRPAGRSGRTRSRRGSSRRARCRRSASAPTRRRSSEPCACGTLRYSASAIASVCSAAATEFDSGALATMIPRFVAASRSTLSTPVPARPMTRSRSARSIRSAVSLVPERIRIASNSPIRSASVGVVPVQPQLDLEVAAQELDAGVGDLLLDENPGQPAR